MIDDEDNDDMSELFQLFAQAQKILGELDSDMYYTSSPLAQNSIDLKEGQSLKFPRSWN